MPEGGLELSSSPYFRKLRTLLTQGTHRTHKTHALHTLGTHSILDSTVAISGQTVTIALLKIEKIFRDSSARGGQYPSQRYRQDHSRIAGDGSAISETVLNSCLFVFFCLCSYTAPVSPPLLPSHCE